MHVSGLVAIFSSLSWGAWAAPASAHHYVVKETHPIPRGWKVSSHPPADHVIHLKIGLAQRNQNELERHVHEVSDPTHPRYRQYLSADEIHHLISPSNETVDLVFAWLKNHGVDGTLGTTKEWIDAALPVEQVEKLLDTKYSVFTHDDGSNLVRTTEGSWSLPQYLHDHIRMVQPTNAFFNPKPQASYLKPVEKDAATIQWLKANRNVAASTTCSVSQLCNTNSVTINCLRCLYGTFGYVAKVPNNNSVAVTNYLGETQIRSDLKAFLSKYRTDLTASQASAAASGFPITIIANGANSQTPAAGQDVEGNLDGQLVVGISYPTKFSAYNTGGEPPFTPSAEEPTNGNEPYLAFLDYIIAQKSLPSVFSTSYGDDEQTVPLSYANSVCDSFKQLAARGITVLFSSGDSGVGPSADECVSNTDGKFKFLPNFPTSCPWITSVGATAGFNPEVAVSRFASGAGFSNYFGQPSYQTSAVANYLKIIGTLNAGNYNASGRAYPDVAAQGNSDVIIVDGSAQTVGGTSASSPTFAGVIALVNDALIAAGKSPLGFLNPLIYGAASTTFTDVTSGSSYVFGFGCGTNGFPAEKGWDAVTGFGTPVSLTFLLYQA
ncbi:tripeptidyl-peptidase 1 precursor [Myriangium duriaei CBS 260.36]|uniref:tripeptidyl-peptidase II n=1 Tax=Myriangium duriaei CBS 260.36 TaxID=1168546 RepID=A0A9P4MH82_9PEZI|nr:tripeptidyl-peptidase 1 precursor [Myriangium duriaei CBS 260.36]